jgi:hypothetical protein
MSFVTDFLFGSDDAADDAADSALTGAQLQAQGQQEALAYMKEREKLPRQFSEGALKGLGGIYGLEGGTGSQQDLIDRAIQSPLYQSIMGGQEAGEESILRNASMTGGLRSGDVQSNLYDYNTQLQNQALLQSYNQQLQGLQGMAGLQSNTNAIAGMTANIGQTLGQGHIAAGQAQQVGSQQGIGNLLGLGDIAGQAGAFEGLGGLLSKGIGWIGSLFSDRRLKNNLEKIGKVNGHNWYIWDWNIVANKMGLEGKSEGVLADELVKTNPECIGIKDGFMIVDYIKLGIFPKGGTA